MDNENQRELDVLAALEGIHRMQESIRDTELDIVVETDRFMQQLKTEGREQYSIGEYVEKVYNPVMNL